MMMITILIRALMCHYCPTPALIALKSFPQADIHLLDRMSISKDSLSAEQMVLTCGDLSLFCLAYL